MGMSPGPDPQHHTKGANHAGPTLPTTRLRQPPRRRRRTMRTTPPPRTRNPQGTPPMDPRLQRPRIQAGALSPPRPTMCPMRTTRPTDRPHHPARRPLGDRPMARKTPTPEPAAALPPVPQRQDPQTAEPTQTMTLEPAAIETRDGWVPAARRPDGTTRPLTSILCRTQPCAAEKATIILDELRAGRPAPRADRIKAAQTRSCC